jgi:hypothetical protein
MGSFSHDSRLLWIPACSGEIRRGGVRCGEQERPMSRIEIKPLTPTLGALVEGADLSRPLDDEAFAQVKAAFLKHKVIFFEDQHLTPVQHRDFASRFGALHTHPLYPGVDRKSVV